MKRSEFRSHQFSIRQEHCAMKVSTDGIILGCLAHIEKAKRILDIGTGTGLLSLMCAQRNCTASIEAIEIDADACKQAQQNVKASPWAQRISVQHADFRNYASPEVDAIICNPPFYEVDLKSASTERNVAMHSGAISIAELLKASATLLAPNGSASFIFPSERREEFLEKAEVVNFFPQRITKIHYVAGKPSIRFVAILGFTKEELVEDALIVQHANNTYTDQYVELTSAFLLKQRSN